MSLDLKIIAAVAENRVIGRYGGIPWDLPGDLIRFQRLTSGKPVIMGRRTFDSIHKRLRRPLPNRDNIVLTRNREFDSAGIFLVYSFEEALNIAKDRFVKKAVKEEGVSEKEAKRIADKLIGATWDVAHINMMRRAGYTEEETKKLGIEEAKKIAPVLKHLHIVDNFGFSDTHLPPGMGNVPIKEII